METTDGRHARRDRNRDAVVDAMLELYDQGDLAPSAEEIASHAGLSPRSLFRYFDDIDDLCRTAITRQQERVMPLVELAFEPAADLASRITAVVEQRSRLFEAISSVGQVSRLRAPFQPVIAHELRASRAFLRRQLQRAFAPELESLGDPDGPALLAAADVLCSFEAYRLLRDDQQLDTTATAGALATALTRLFAPAPDIDEGIT